MAKIIKLYTALPGRKRRLVEKRDFKRRVNTKDFKTKNCFNLTYCILR